MVILPLLMEVVQPMKVPKPRKVSSGNYFIQLRLGGESISVTAVNEKECRRQAALIKAEYLAGVKQRRKVGMNKTLRQAIDDYIAARSNTLSPSTIRGYRFIQKGRFRSVMDKAIKDIKNWQEVCNIEAKLCSPKTLRNAFRFITSVLSDVGVTLPKVTLPQVQPKERPWLEPEQVLNFVKAVKGKPCEISALLALHSLRRSEICALTWEDIDLEKKRITVRGATVMNEHNEFVRNDKNKNVTSTRTIPIMIPELFAALKDVKNKTGLVVPYHPNTIREQINRVCEENNLPKVGVHGLRHSFASLAYHLGMSERETMEIGGWADTQTMHKIYTHLARVDRLNAESKMTEFFSSANKNAN